jgi:hypothetical protein
MPLRIEEYLDHAFCRRCGQGYRENFTLTFPPNRCRITCIRCSHSWELIEIMAKLPSKSERNQLVAQREKERAARESAEAKRIAEETLNRAAKCAREDVIQAIKDGVTFAHYRIGVGAKWTESATLQANMLMQRLSDGEYGMTRVIENCGDMKYLSVYIEWEE